MAKSSLSTAFFRIVKVINSIAKYFIKWPTYDEIENISENFYNIAGVDNVIGAIDGTFVPIKAPKLDPEAYVTRKCNYAITLQATSVASLRFIDCFIGYPGSVSDTRIFRNSDLYINSNANRGLYFPNNTFIIGDKAYPLLDWCIPPYLERGNMNAAKRNFNLKISQTRQIIERSFALLFGRFRRLKFLDMNRVDYIPATVLACCVLHNLCLDNTDIYIDQYIEDGFQYVIGNDDTDVNAHLHRDMNIAGREGHAKREDICRRLFEIEV